MREVYKQTRLPEVAVVGDAGPVQGVVSKLSEDDRLRVSDFSNRDLSQLDCLLASADELDTVRQVLPDSPDLPFVVFGKASTRDEAVETGALEHVRIPVEDEDMFARRLRRYAEGHRSKRNRQRLDSVFRHSPDQIVLHDENGAIVDVNSRVSEALGYSREELLEMHVSEIEVGIDQEQLESLWSEYEYGSPIRREGRHRRKDGTEFPVEVNLGKVLYGDDELFLAIVRDITERKEAEREADRLRREQETIFRNVQDPMFLVEEREDGFYFQRLNPAYEEQTGISEEQAQGKMPREVFGEEAGEELAENYRRCLEKGETLSYEEKLEVPEGLRDYKTKISPVYTDNGKRQVVGSARDITERKKRERELEEYEAFIENSSDLVTHLGEDGTILYSSPSAERVLGYEMGENQGKNTFDFVHPEDKERVFKEFAEFVAGPDEVVEGIEFRMRDADGEYVWLDVTATDQTDTEVGGVIVNARDITERKEYERKLERRSEAMEAAAEGIAILDSDGEYVYVNEAHADIYGYDKADDLLGETWRMLYDDEEAEQFESEVMPVLEQEGEWSGEATGLRADGTKFPQQISLTLLEDGGRVCIVRDITERKERERELERYESYVKGTSDIITHLDEDGTVLFQSESMERVLGHDPDEMVGENVMEYLHPDDRGHITSELSSLVNDSVKITQDVEFRFRHADGSYVWLEAVGRDETDTELGGVVVSSRDVTERREREEKLERYRQIVESSQDVLWMFSPDFSETIFINSPYEEIFGQSVEELRRETTGFVDMVHPDDRSHLLRTMEKAPEREVEFEVRVNPEEDYGRWIWGRGQPVHEDGEVVGIAGFTRDVTERKKREEELREKKKILERRKEQIQFFNSLLRHDMLNSMNVIHGNAGMLIESLPGDSEDYDRAERIRRQSDDIIELTNRVRSVLKTVGEGTDVFKVSLSDVVEERAESIRESYDAEVNADVPEGLCVEADDLLGDVLGNLLVNAVEHNDKEEPRVEVTVEEDDEKATVRVADNGPGVPEELKEEIFREGAKGRTSGGIGFGLYFVESMVTEYGGDVRVEDNEPEGAVFVIELPLA